jgi:hypothetical protein
MQKERSHKVSPLWTIWIPLVCGTLILGIILVLLLLSSANRSSAISNLSSISIIIVVFPFMLIGVVGFFIIIFLIRFLSQLSLRMPIWLLNISSFSEKWLHRVDTLSDLSIRPFIFINTIILHFESLVKKIRNISHLK